MIEVVRPGLFTTLQDLGRFGYRSMGVPISGPMDSQSAATANELLCNDPNCALIEIAYVGASFLFHNAAMVAFSGATCEVKLNDKLIENQTILQIEAGNILSFGAMTRGNFLYLAIEGGFKSDLVLGSACYYEAITGIARMSKGTKLNFDLVNQEIPQRHTSIRKELVHSSAFIEVEKGPEFDLLSADEISLLTSTDFSVSPQSNRMGFLLNEAVNIGLKEIISSPVQPGTIQLTKGGQLIVLMRDAQTTGGYPRILQLNEESINRLVQYPRNLSFQFSIVE